MKESQERANSLASYTEEKKYPNEYIEKANELLKLREKDEQELMKELSPLHGRDDRLSEKLHELDLKLRADLADLRREYGI